MNRNVRLGRVVAGIALAALALAGCGGGSGTSADASGLSGQLKASGASFPDAYYQAARIDGASEIRIFLRLILPLGLPAIASLAIFQFLWTWNDLIVALSLARDTQPITVAIFSQLRQFGANLELIAPAAFVSLAIPLAVFFAFQRYFVQGLLAGSVK